MAPEVEKQSECPRPCRTRWATPKQPTFDMKAVLCTAVVNIPTPARNNLSGIPRVEVGVQCSVEEDGDDLGLFKGLMRTKRRSIIHAYTKPPFRQQLQLKDEVKNNHSQDQLKVFSQFHFYGVHTEREMRDKINKESDIDPETIDHFSLYESPEEIVMFASKLCLSEQLILVDRFLGKQICGVRLKDIKSQGRPYSKWNRASDRYVQEASLIARAAPSFQSALEDSAKALLFDGIGGLSNEKTTIISLAHLEPLLWGGRARTALDFVARLARAGAIKSISHDIIQKKLYELRSRCFFDAWSRCRKSKRQGVTTLESPTSKEEEECEADDVVTSGLQRTLSSPPVFGVRTTCFNDMTNLIRSFSTPVEPSTSPKHARSIGTSLRPQDYGGLEKAPSLFSTVSFAKSLHEYIPLDISLRDLPDYWRHVAGGDFTPEEREAKAKAAEHELQLLEGEACQEMFGFCLEST